MKKNFDFIRECLDQSKGRNIATIDVETFSPPIDIPVHKDRDGDVRPALDWFKDNFTNKSEGYDVICMHISENYKKKWNLSKHIGGTYWNDGAPYEFYIVADRGDQARHYDFDEFTRRFIHEMLHGDSYTGDIRNNTLHPRDWVHRWDYNLHSIHRAPTLIDFTRYNTQKKIIRLLKKVIDLYAKISYLPSTTFK